MYYKIFEQIGYSFGNFQLKFEIKFKTVLKN